MFWAIEPVWSAVRYCCFIRWIDMISSKLAIIFSELWRRVKFFCHTKSKVSISVKSIWLIISKYFWISFALWGDTKTQNSSLAHVLHCKIWLKCRKMFSIIFTDRYDPKETWKHSCWVFRSNKNFSAALTFKRLDYWNPSF